MIGLSQVDLPAWSESAPNVYSKIMSETLIGEAGANADAGSESASPDYSSRQGMVTDVWGPAAWLFLHTMSFNYPVQPTADQRRQYRAFILGLQHTLPCGKCRENLKKNLRQMPLTMRRMESRATFSRYMYDLHEKINCMLGKPSGLTYEQIRDRFEQFRSRCSTTKSGSSVEPTPRERGCTEPLAGVKKKCVIHIVPKTKRCRSFTIDRKCMNTRRKQSKDRAGRA